MRSTDVIPSIAEETELLFWAIRVPVNGHFASDARAIPT